MEQRIPAPLPESKAHNEKDHATNILVCDSYSTAQRFHRYYFRAIITPITITGVFIVMWIIYLGSLDKSSEFITGLMGGIYIFCSWFVISVLGLPLYLYGMNAVEAGILIPAIANRAVLTTLVAYDNYGAGT